MIDLFYQGGPLFMGVLSVLFMIIVGYSLYALLFAPNSHKKNQAIQSIKSIGIFAFIIGILGHFIGLFSAFKAVKMGEVEASSSLFSDGFKISMISSIYGLLILSMALLIWWLFKHKWNTSN